MRVLVDANVIGDAIIDPAERPQGDRPSAQLILDAIAKKRVDGVITAPIFTFVVHFAKPRRMDHREQVEAALDFLLDIMEWAPVTPNHCRTAIASTFHDIEDGIEFFAVGRVDAIITRDPKGFKDHVNVGVYSASEFIKKHPEFFK